MININLPNDIWSVHDSIKLQKEIMQFYNLSFEEFLQKASTSIYEKIKKIYPNLKNWLLLCGHNLNGLYGYSIAILAYYEGYNVNIIDSQEKIFFKNQYIDSLREIWKRTGKKIYSLNSTFPKANLIIDALLGDQLYVFYKEKYEKIIKKVNMHHAKTLSIDIPSGLISETGNTFGETIQADDTIIVLFIKPGHLTGKARQYIGKIHYIHLNMNNWLKRKKSPIQRINTNFLKNKLLPRSPILHKGNCGKILVIGGYKGTVGAVYMTAEGALRAGAGLVKILTHKENIAMINITVRPELMVNELTKFNLEKEILWSDVIIIGPGLGKNQWGKFAFLTVINSKKPILLDADALSILSEHTYKNNNCIITPHPKEAAVLLNVKIQDIENNRLSIAKELRKKHKGIVVLKGPGTIIASKKKIAIADIGNVGMATGGMGDILSGIIGSFMVDMDLFTAASIGCIAHGAAADFLAKKKGTRGLLATDLFKVLYKFINPRFLKK
ncbi:bifunctional ADP-dependent NAD(P)H-hydrate dehydratase/NAD(P)H-hydrate epimerase [Candidatus Tachikawaea gelatinosa]|uniref:ADP-dependent (S)-NAD(P)H-hydrate dehydratase n=1 Tax=Candidatus Tachikawaea gelatinosa TaxID=1410383 RepID=A0A090ARB0_9ENTR|nr:bifunctional ADP-dependent NAD(P)H-hydrate dehydratase/NAD(P)H-hydrate epimerase [Candidatus Tachikawaea gelatinosa]BAP58295.1 sugar kinase [Candidatus Tachikawaea gelatinosa]